MPVTTLKLKDFLMMDISVPGFRKKLSKKDLAYMCRQLSFVFESAMPLEAGLRLVASAAKSKPLRDAVEAARAAVMRGESLSAGFADAPEFFRRMLAVAERSGMLGQTFSWLADYYEKEYHFGEEIQSAFAYPALVAVMMLCVIVMSVTYVIPNYADMFAASGVDLPLPTRVLVGVSSFVTGYFWPLLAAVGAAVAGLAMWLRSEGGVTFADGLKLRVGLYRKTLNARFAQALRMALASGENAARAVETAANVADNKVFAAYLREAAADVYKGVPLARALSNAPCVDALLTSMLGVGEETGKLRDTSSQAAEFLAAEAEAGLKKMNKLIEPAVTAALGGVLAFIMLAVMLPAFKMAEVL